MCCQCSSDHRVDVEMRLAASVNLAFDDRYRIKQSLGPNRNECHFTPIVSFSLLSCKFIVGPMPRICKDCSYQLVARLLLADKT